MDVLLMGQLEFSHKELLHDQVNPFCTNENMNLWSNQNDESELTSIPISQIKMTGYLQFGEKQAALLLLPNKMTVMVERGNLLGKERARVAGIYSDHVLVDLQTGGEIKLELIA
jgi:Tfp pilus assembly protein PilP